MSLLDVLVTRKKTINRQVGNMLRIYRLLIQPQKTHGICVTGEFGEENAHQGKRQRESNARNNHRNNPRNSKIWNPRRNQKRKEENRLAAEQYLRTCFADQYHALLTQDAAVTEGKTILDKSYPELGNVSIQEFLRNNPYAGLYVGMTGQVLETEDRKSKNMRGDRNRRVAPLLS
mmetsp:Transcript_2526/g.2836  ORF Transcript_2526/g.2836 Transcript_2526/m.2836 type:complete len:175 (+) Transcript_2526:288-812(+)